MKHLRWAIPALLVVALAAPGVAQRARGKSTTPATAPAKRPAPAAVPPSPASSERLDGVAAVVNDDVILQSDVEEQLYLFLAQNQLQPDSTQLDTLRHQILDQLINEKLIVAEAKRQGIGAPDNEVKQQVDGAIASAKQRLGSDEAFKEQLRKENLTEEKLRARYKEEATRQLMVQNLMRREFPTRPVPASEAEAFFKANPDKFPKAPAQVKLSVIQIPASPDSATDAAAKAKLLAARRRIVAGEKFAKVAAEVSEDPGSAKAGGDLSFFTRGTFEPALEQAAFSLKIGELSQPIRTPYGWHLLEVLERDTVKTAAGKDSLDADKKPVPEAHARHILIRVETSDADIERARKLAERVRAEAAKGTDFATLVRRYSKYQGPASPEGDIGFVSLASLQPQIRQGLDTLEVGEISQVLENQVGFNIFKLTDRKAERPYTLEEIKDELPAAVAQIRMQEKREAWIKGLRAKANIEIRRI